MDLWHSRQKSLAWLANELVEQNALIDKGFEMLDRCISLLNQYSKRSNNELDSKFALIINLTLAKTRNLLLGSYGMMLDAAAQEAGALLRPILEAYELLIYFQLEPSRVNEAFDGKLPPPGERAKKIKGEFKGLRDYLNTHASHINFDYESSKHLFDTQISEVKAVQTQNIDVFKRNVTTLNAFQIFVVAEAIRCFDIIERAPKSLTEEY